MFVPTTGEIEWLWDWLLPTDRRAINVARPSLPSNAFAWTRPSDGSYIKLFRGLKVTKAKRKLFETLGPQAPYALDASDMTQYASWSRDFEVAASFADGPNNTGTGIVICAHIPASAILCDTTRWPRVSMFDTMSRDTLEQLADHYTRVDTQTPRTAEKVALLLRYFDQEEVIVDQSRTLDIVPVVVYNSCFVKA